MGGRRSYWSSRRSGYEYIFMHEMHVIVDRGLNMAWLITARCQNYKAVSGGAALRFRRRVLLPNTIHCRLDFILLCSGKCCLADLLSTTAPHLLHQPRLNIAKPCPQRCCLALQTGVAPFSTPPCLEQQHLVLIPYSHDLKGAALRCRHRWRLVCTAPHSPTSVHLAFQRTSC